MMERMLSPRPYRSQLRQGPYRSLRQSGEPGLIGRREMSVLHKDCPDTHKTHGQVWSSFTNGQEERPATFMSLGGLPSGDMSLLPTLFMSPEADDEGARRENGGHRVAD